MTVASGQQAGKSYGIDLLKFEIGNEPACDVSVVDESGTGHPTGARADTRRLRVERGSSGWTVRDLSGIGFFVNQSYVRSTSELRSGDIVRLTWKGPDVQFLLQSSSQSLNRLVEQYLPVGDADQSEAELVAEAPGPESLGVGSSVVGSSLPAAAALVATVPDAPTDETDQSYSARDTRILPNANTQAKDSARDSASDLRKTSHVSREALAAVQTFQEHKRQARPPIVWLVAAAAIVILVLLSALAYMIRGAG